MSKPADEFEATRIIVDTLKEFKQADQQMIFRWAAEKLGLPPPFGVGAGNALRASVVVPPTASAMPAVPATSAIELSTQDIKSFVAVKNPRSDVQFATTVAYYYEFEAPHANRKSSINKDDLLEACRLVGRERLTNPGQTLRNAHQLGMLDKGDEAGTFTVNTVGENLVAMTLPGGAAENTKGRKPKKAPATKAKQTAHKAKKV